MAISIENLYKSFGGKAVINNISLEIKAGELVALIGPSGCGKSTLLRCLNGLERFDSGQIRVNGLNIPGLKDEAQSNQDFTRIANQLRQNVGMVFQSFNLFPHLNLIENVALAPQVVRGQAKEQALTTAEALIAKVGLSTHANHYPQQLSGGQQQRAAIARALAMSPQILLYDEPTSALDPQLVHEVLQVMKQLDQEGMTQVVVTHEMRFARDVSDRVVFLEQGQVVEMGPPEQVFQQPNDPRTQEFLRHFL